MSGWMDEPGIFAFAMISFCFSYSCTHTIFAILHSKLPDVLYTPPPSRHLLPHAFSLYCLVIPVAITCVPTLSAPVTLCLSVVCLNQSCYPVICCLIRLCKSIVVYSYITMRSRNVSVDFFKKGGFSKRKRLS